MFRLIRHILLLLSGTAAMLLTTPAMAVPSFADQTGQPCQGCHVGGFGPQLTPFGREFKLRGYTMRTNSKALPIAAMAVGSFSHTAKDQASPPTSGFHRNDNFAFDEGSIFLAGGMGSHFGGFAQITYDGVDKSWAWDNLDMRLVNTGQIGGKELIYGLTLNNNPTIQDAWNSTPGWGFPYTDSALLPGPSASVFMSDGLAQNVMGLSAYAWIDSHYYIEAGGYVSPSRGTLKWLGSDPYDPGNIHGIAPYGRIAWQGQLGGGTTEIGAFAMKTSIWPGRDRSSSFTDRHTDVGVDASWQRTLGSGDIVALNTRYTHEKLSLKGSCALGVLDGSIPGCASGSLNEIRADASYYWHNKIGLTVSGFNLSGSSNAAFYEENARPVPNSTGAVAQIDATPWGDGSSPLGKLFNMRVGVQYTAFTKFDGTSSHASNNNSVRVFTWLAY